MHAPIKYAEKGLAIAANGAWAIFSQLNKINQGPSMTPKWSDKPILKSWQKTKPTLGFPRQTGSLCPNCVIEAREAIISGKRDVSIPPSCRSPLRPTGDVCTTAAASERSFHVRA